jgi:alpha-1,2-mannosyltransferase
VPLPRLGQPTGEGAHRRSAAGACLLTGPRTVALALILVGSLAASIQAFELTQPNHLLGIAEYDDGVYLGNAIRLIHGALPYRDFVSVQPPGSTILMIPVAVLSHWLGTRGAMAVARILTSLVQVTCVVLVGLLVRKRGCLAVAFAGGLLAVYPSSVSAAHTLLLEPYETLFCMIGILAAAPSGELTNGPRRLAIAGVAFGFAGTIKLWAVVPFLALVLVETVESRRRTAPLMAGATAGFVLPCLPFLIGAPGAFVHEAFLSQLERRSVSPLSGWLRLSYLDGLWHAPWKVTDGLELAVAIAVLALMGGALALGGVRQPLETYLTLAAVASSAVLFLPPEFYYHYAAFPGPFLVAALTMSVWRIADAVPALRYGPPVLLLTVAVGAAFVTPRTLAGINTQQRFGDLAGAMDPYLPAGSCVVSDTAAALISLDRFVARRQTCPSLVDAQGLQLSDAVGRSSAAAIEMDNQQWLAMFAHADYVVLSPTSPRRIAWTPNLRRVFSHEYVRVAAPGWPIYRHR